MLESLSPKDQATVQHMLLEVEKSKLYAMYHLACATTGEATRHHVVRGDDHVLTAEELTDRVLETALAHIHRIGRLQDNILSVMNGKPPTELI